MNTKFANLLRFIAVYARLVRDPNRLDLVLGLTDRVVARYAAIGKVPPYLHQPVVSAYLEKRPASLEIDMSTLARMAPGSLGYEFAVWMDTHQLDPAAFERQLGTSDMAVVKRHLEGTHDIWHVVTGFGTDVAGEIGLQAFYLAQLRLPTPMALLSAAFLNALFFAQDDIERRMDAIVRGWVLGQGAEPLFGVDWNQLWPLPLAEVRKKLGLPVSDDCSQESMQALWERSSSDLAPMNQNVALEPVSKQAAG